MTNACMMNMRPLLCILRMKTSQHGVDLRSMSSIGLQTCFMNGKSPTSRVSLRTSNLNDSAVLSAKYDQHLHIPYQSRSYRSGTDKDSGDKRLVWSTIAATLGGLVVGNLIWNRHSTLKADEGTGTIKSAVKGIQQKFGSSDLSSSMLLYWASGSPPCWRVMITLEEKGLKNYQSKLLQMSAKEHKTADVIKINPRGQLPTFKHGDVIVNESLAIVDYLESCFPNQGTTLLPVDPAKRAHVLQRKYEALNLFSKGLEGYTFYSFRKPEEKTQSETEAKLKAFREELDVWENILKEAGPDSFVAGKDFSIADVVLFPTLALMWRLGLNLDKYSHIKAYFEKIRKRDSVQATWPPHWKGENNTILRDV